MNTAEEVARILLDIKAVTLRPEDPYRYTSGILSPIYTDCRMLISFPKERTRVIELLVGSLKDLSFEVVAGTATAGIPHAAWIAHELQLPMVYARSKAKAHGKQMQIEGHFESGQSAVVVEDLISTAKSSLETVDILRQSGGTVEHIAAIFSYELPIAAQNLSEAKVRLSSLTTFKDIVRVAVETGYLKEEDSQNVLDWAEDAQGWGKKMGLE